VPEHGSPTVRRRRLAAEVRRLRERAGLTEEEVAERLDWSSSKLSRIELHRTGLKPHDLARLLELYQVSEAHREELLELAREPRRRGWWEAYSDDALPEEYAAFIGLEAEAESESGWSPDIVYGLLQTEDYARALICAHMGSSISPGDIERRVETRMVRQHVVTRDEPFTLSVVLDESALLRLFGTQSVMRQQMERLVEASQLPNVNLRVLPLTGPHPVGTGEFVILKFAPAHGTRLHDVVYIEQLTRSALYVEDEVDTREYSLAFDRLIAQALDPAKSRELITKTMREYWS
jgi:transcriptional regulator with XRE-family HTH domain